mmetsp:Transcript_13382/g.17696  ORF Transcript_13382/g.17696 Transcript_13382/m.17696 type:complete len:202 (-) Transcript_13382:605-1210(-)
MEPLSSFRPSSGSSRRSCVDSGAGAGASAAGNTPEVCFRCRLPFLLLGIAFRGRDVLDDDNTGGVTSKLEGREAKEEEVVVAAGQEGGVVEFVMPRGIRIVGRWASSIISCDTPACTLLTACTRSSLACSQVVVVAVAVVFAVAVVVVVVLEPPPLGHLVTVTGSAPHCNRGGLQCRGCSLTSGENTSTMVTLKTTAGEGQ